ncbi:universal stress family protein [Sphingopyxis sp. C-1]|nr:universal stress family protein [Sphingopyxis sp. C-1]
MVIDDSPEASLALRFAARRAARTGGGVIVLAIIPPQDFVAFGGVQATIEAEAREHAEELVAAASDAVVQEGVTPQAMVKLGKPAEVVCEVIRANDEIAALVLATAASGAPGPLVTFFTGQDAGSLPCPVMLVPGGIDIARLDALS